MKKIAIPFLTALAIALLGYFIISKPDNVALTVENVSVSISSDYPIYTDIADMTAKSDLIVIGKYTAFVSDWNMDRNPADPNEESETSYSVGKLYTFGISETVKGVTSSNNISIIKAFSSEASYSLESGEAIKYQMPSQYFIEPVLQTQYMLFLTYDPLFDRYYPIGEPWEILIEANNQVTLKSNLFNAESDMSPILLSEALHENTIYKFSIGGSDIGRYENFIGLMGLDEIVAATRE